MPKILGSLWLVEACAVKYLASVGSINQIFFLETNWPRIFNSKVAIVASILKSSLDPKLYRFVE